MGAIRRWSVLVSWASLVLVTATGATAQAQGATPAASPASGILAQATVDALPGGDAEVWLGRLEIDPGGIVPDRLQTGPVLLYVESGLVSVTSDVPLEGMVGGERIADMQPDYTCPCQQLHGESAGWSGSLSVATGQSTLVPANATQGLANNGTVPASVLVLAVGAALPIDGQEGVSVETLATTGDVALTGGAFTLTIERATIAGGESVEQVRTSVVELGAVESGAVEAEVGAGDVQAYDAGDSYIFAGGNVTWTAGDDPVTILSAVISPAPA